jgi:hypothetical protein
MTLIVVGKFAVKEVLFFISRVKRDPFLIFSPLNAACKTFSQSIPTINL